MSHKAKKKQHVHASSGVRYPREYHHNMSPHSSYMIRQTRTFYRKIISIGVVFSNSYVCEWQQYTTYVRMYVLCKAAGN